MKEAENIEAFRQGREETGGNTRSQAENNEAQEATRRAFDGAGERPLPSALFLAALESLLVEPPKEYPEAIGCWKRWRKDWRIVLSKGLPLERALLGENALHWHGVVRAYDALAFLRCVERMTKKRVSAWLERWWEQRPLQRRASHSSWDGEDTRLREWEEVLREGWLPLVGRCGEASWFQRLQTAMRSADLGLREAVEQACQQLAQRHQLTPGDLALASEQPEQGALQLHEETKGRLSQVPEP